MSDFKNSLIGKISRLVHHFKQLRFADLDTLGLYPGQPRLLNVLMENNGMSQREMAEKMAIAPATLSRMIGRMEKNGYLNKKADKKDHRVIHIFSTPQAREVMSELSKVNDRMEETLYRGFSEREKNQFIQYLDRINENASLHSTNDPVKERSHS
jgi:MarR family transcriptional regulator, organic hydroperoxide resistance regulator